MPDLWLKGFRISISGGSDGRIFFSKVIFLCWLLFWHPSNPRDTAAARKRPRSFCQKCRCQVTAKHVFAWSEMVHGCMAYTERAETATASSCTSHASAVNLYHVGGYSTKQQQNNYKRLVTYVESHPSLIGHLASVDVKQHESKVEPHATAVSLLESGKQCYTW